MIFTTYWFFAFAALVTVVFWLIRPQPVRLAFLSVACLVFHAHFAGPAGMIPVLILMVVTYGCGRLRSPAACGAGIVLNVLALCFYKYTLFAIAAGIQPWSADLAAQLTERVRALSPAAAPLGISFFVFEFVHYLYEIRKGGQPITNPLKFLLFAIFYPSLVAGPIKRYQTFVGSLDTDTRRWNASDCAEGLRRIGIGFAKKVLIADNLTAIIDSQQAGFATAGLFERWLFVLMLGGRILMDFSGYSDIAIGTARLLGIQLPENFNWPYLARNLQDFWQRWHISLSTWIRDYVYIPLGGNRHGHVRRLINGLIAFALCGLWHGPSWNFVVWGLYHGVGLAICASYAKIPGISTAIRRVFEKEPVSSWLITQVYVFVGWVLFFYPLDQALVMIKLLFRP